MVEARKEYNKIVNRISADTAKCTGNAGQMDTMPLCVNRNSCLRYVAVSNERQVWSEFNPSMGECEGFIEVLA